MSFPSWAVRVSARKRGSTDEFEPAIFYIEEEEHFVHLETFRQADNLGFEIHHIVSKTKLAGPSTMPKPFDPTKPCQNGRRESVRIICTDKKGPFPIVALHGEGEALYVHRRDGTVNGASWHDLVNVPERTSRWLAVGPEVGVESKEDLHRVYGYILGHPILEMIHEDGRLVDVKLHNPEEPR